MTGLRKEQEHADRPTRIHFRLQRPQSRKAHLERTRLKRKRLRRLSAIDLDGLRVEPVKETRGLRERKLGLIDITFVHILTPRWPRRWLTQSPTPMSMQIWKRRPRRIVQPETFFRNALPSCNSNPWLMKSAWLTTRRNNQIISLDPNQNTVVATLGRSEPAVAGSRERTKDSGSGVTTQREASGRG